VSAADALKAARTAGVEVHVDGDDLVLEAAAPLPSAILDLLLLHKPDIVMLLRPGRDGQSAADWHAFYHERARFAAFDGLPRPKAEAFTFASCIAQWQTCNFVPSPPGLCVICGGADCPHDPLLPHGMGLTGHA
jgi:hypothetical protein